MIPATRCLAVVLAAGEGTRMRSVAAEGDACRRWRPMLDAVIAGAKAAGIDKVAVVVGAGAVLVRAHLAKAHPDVEIYEQTERKGTAHAVLAARPALEAHAGEVVVLYGDTPLVRPRRSWPCARRSPPAPT